jgi:ubiquitin carboxyl-terminal hydrolase 36/42
VLFSVDAVAVAMAAPWPRADGGTPAQPAGLSNLGNTCYLNSVVQCLAALPPVHAVLAASDARRCSCGGVPGATCLPCVLAATLAHWRASGGVAVAPRALVACMHALNGDLAAGQQHDAPELYHWLLATCAGAAVTATAHAAAAGRVATWVEQLFGGVTVTRTRCPACAHVSSVFEPFVDLSLELAPEAASLAELLEAYVRAEKLDDANRIRCAGCNTLQRSTRQLAVVTVRVLT